MNLWYESSANHGSTKISACSSSYVTKNYQPIVAGAERKLIVWSDKYVEQNNNFTMVTLREYLIR
jgi:hypothetical protein